MSGDDEPPKSVSSKLGLLRKGHSRACGFKRLSDSAFQTLRHAIVQQFEFGQRSL